VSTSSNPAPESAAAPDSKASPKAILGPSPWLWMVLACVFLATSGAIRVYQERQFDAAAREVKVAPFPLKNLPQSLGRWRMSGEEQELDPDTLEIAGSSDYMARTYVDDQTGVPLSALVVFGPAEQVFPHDPTVCFPAFGYQTARGVRNHTISTPDGPVTFASAIYTKQGGGVPEYVEVYFSFRHDGQWSPAASETRKQFRHKPAMFKIQVQRPIGPQEIESGSDVPSPIEEFLEQLVPVLEEYIAAAEDPATPSIPTEEEIAAALPEPDSEEDGDAETAEAD